MDGEGALDAIGSGLVKRIAGGDIILQIKTVDGIESHIGLFIKTSHSRITASV